MGMRLAVGTWWPHAGHGTRGTGGGGIHAPAALQRGEEPQAGGVVIAAIVGGVIVVVVAVVVAAAGEVAEIGAVAALALPELPRRVAEGVLDVEAVGLLAVAPAVGVLREEGVDDVADGVVTRDDADRLAALRAVGLALEPLAEARAAKGVQARLEGDRAVEDVLADAADEFPLHLGSAGSAAAAAAAAARAAAAAAAAARLPPPPP